MGISAALSHDPLMFCFLSLMHAALNETCGRCPRCRHPWLSMVYSMQFASGDERFATAAALHTSWSCTGHAVVLPELSWVHTLSFLHRGAKSSFDWCLVITDAGVRLTRCQKLGHL